MIADATDEAATEDLFARAGDQLELAIYNTGNNTPGRIIDMSADFFAESWRVCCFGGFLFGREAIKKFTARSTGAHYCSLEPVHRCAGVQILARLTRQRARYEI